MFAVSQIYDCSLLAHPLRFLLPAGGKLRLGMGLDTRSHSSRRSATPERGAAAVKAQKLRISPQSLVSPEGYNYNQDICIWDDEQFTVSQEIKAGVKDFDATLSQIASYKPAILTALNPLLVKFRRYFDQLDRAKFGFDHHHLTEGVNIDNLPEIIGELEELLTPKFPDIIQGADSLDTSNMTAKERHELKWVNDLFKRKSKQDNKNALEELPSNWLIASLKVLDSKQG